MPVSSKKRILLVSQWFEPEPTFKGLVFARELVRLGYDVEVVTGFPNYPGGKLYPGYKLAWRRRETIEGIAVTRLPLYPSHDNSPLRRVANYLSFALATTLYCLFMARRADVVYVYQLPTLGAAAALVKAFRRTRLVFDVQDVWPDSLRATGMVGSETVLRIVDLLARWVYRRADVIVVLSAGFRRLLVERGAPESKIELIHNWCDERSLNAPGAADLCGFPGNETFSIVFAGNMGKAQALGAVLDAAGLLQTQCARVRLVFIGGGVEADALRAAARERALSNVIFLPRVGMDSIGGYLRAADALLVHLKADPLFSITIPGKTQAYMAMGKPILMAVAGNAADLVKMAGCGIEAIPEDAASIANAALRLASLSSEELRALGQRGRDYYYANLAVAVGVAKFASVFERATGETPVVSGAA